MMNEMMEETLLTGTARKAELPGWRAAGKTGTSQDFRDAWFVGYTSRLVAGVWLGNDDNSPTKKASGGNLPVEIWSRFMIAAHQGVPAAPLPSSPPRPASEPEPSAALQPFDALLGMFTASPPPPTPPPRPSATANPRPAPAKASRERVRNEPDEAPAPPPRVVEDFLPPEDIPAPGAKRAEPRRNAGDDKNLLDKLFGG
jgi:penicillin-binding protein 1A